LKRRFSTTVAFIFFLLAPGTHASAAVVSLSQALKMAREYWYPKADGPVVDAKLGYQLAKANLLPSLSSAYAISKDFIASPATPTVNNGTVTLTQNLINVSDWKTTHARDIDVVAGNCATEAALFTISEQVITDFFGVLASIDEEKIQLQRQNRITQLTDLLTETTKLRISARSDLFSAQSESSRVASQLLQVGSDKENAIGLLRSQLGTSPTEVLLIDDHFLVAQGPDLKDWKKWASSLPDVMNLHAKTVSSDYDYSAANWQAAPTVALSGTYATAYGGESTGLIYNNPSLIGMITVSLPIFDQGVRSANAAHALAYRSIYEGQASAKKTENENLISNLIMQRQATIKALEQAKIQMDLAQKAYDGTWELLSLGKKDYSSLRTAEEDLLVADRSQISLQRRLDQANANLQIFYDTANRIKSSSRDSTKCTPSSIE
jgi:multidrug efflux system outer membrane protein